MVRRKRSIERLESSSERAVTFTKRRRGLFQKASDLCMLCDARIAIIVFSPHGNPFVFGHSSVHAVTNHYLNGTVPAGGATTPEHTRLVREIKEGEAWLKNEKKRQVLIKKERESSKDGKGKEKVEVDLYEWFKIEEKDYSSLEELQSLYDKLMEAKENIMQRRGIMLSSMGNYFGNNVYVDPKTLPGPPSTTVVQNASPKFTYDNACGNFNYAGNDVNNSLLHSNGADRNFNEVYQNVASVGHVKPVAVLNNTAKTTAIHEEVANYSGRRGDDSGDYFDVFDSLPQLFD